MLTVTYTATYTTHEEFKLINMNGRVYDPLTARFLSPDNYVQLPNSTQGYNRYSYCLNNPLLYTDPTGEIFGLVLSYFAVSHIGGAIEAICNGGLDPGKKMSFRGGHFNMSFDTERMENAWTKADPTLSGTRANNFWRQTGGLFEWDHGQNGNTRFGNAFYDFRTVASRFMTPWGVFVTSQGYGLNGGLNAFGEVDHVDYYHGATVTYASNQHNQRLSAGGLTLGNYILINSANSESNITNNNNHLLMHEFGHTIQYRKYGPFAIPMEANSLVSAGGGWASTSHGNTWWEADANYRSYSYLKNSLSIEEENAWLADAHGSNMVSGGGKWWRNSLSYLMPGGFTWMFFYNIHYSGK